MAETVKKTVLDIDASQSTTSIKELRNQLKLLKDQMAGLEEGSDAFLELANSAGTVKHQIDEINQSVRGASADFGDMLGNASKSAAGIVGAFQTVRGALSLVGIESEGVEKAIQKMQASMAIVQGLGAVDNGIKGFKKLRAAIIATTGPAKVLKAVLEPKVILALTAAVTAITLAWKKFGDQIGEVIPAVGRVKSKFEDANKPIKEQLDELHQLIGDYEEWSKGEKVKKLNDSARKSYESLNDEIEKQTRRLTSAEEAQKYLSGATLAVKRNNEQLIATLKDTIQSLKDKQDQILKNDDSYKRHTEVIKEATEAETDFATEIQTIQDRLENRKHQIIEIEEEVENADEWLGKIGEASNFADSILGSQDTFLDQLNLRQQALDSFYSQNLLSQEKYTEASNALSQERAMYWTMYAAQAVQQIGSMLNQLASYEDTNTREGFERNKKLRIAGATMDMLAGMVSAMVNSIRDLGIPAGPIVGAALSAMVAGLGGAQIANIKKQQFGGSNSYSSPSISTSAISAAQTPIQYTQDIQGISLEESIKSTRVYVVESDIAKASTRVQVQEQENTY